jgi:hypothetical protein
MRRAQRDKPNKMLCLDVCPRKMNCEPISNVVSDSGVTFVCVGYHQEKDKKIQQDRFRHCFKSAAETDSIFDYDEFDLLSVVTVMNEALLVDNMKKNGSTKEQ